MTDVHSLPHVAKVTCDEVHAETGHKCDRHAGHCGPHRSGTPTHVLVEWGWAHGGVVIPTPAGQWP